MIDPTLARAAELMRHAAGLIRDHCPSETVQYDGTTCDGECLADDLESTASDISGGECEE